MKICIKCHKEKPLEEFTKCGFTRNKQCRRNECKLCSNALKRLWNKNNPAATKLSSTKKHLKKRFNLTLDKYHEILKNQNGCCAICDIHYSKLPKRLCVDHDHETGRIRGLLCTDCNANKVGSNTLESLSKIQNYFMKQENI